PANEDWSLAPNTPVPYLGAYANTAWLPAMPQISPLPSSEPKCIGSCFAINSAKVGIEAVEVEGLTMIEVTSMVGNQPRITRYVADINETDDDDDDEDDDQKLGDVTVVNDGVNGKVAINTSGKPMLTLYQSFGAYTVTKIGVLTDPDTKGNDVEIKGSFDPISPIVPSVDAVTCKLSDQTGHSVSVTIPPQSLVSSGRALKYKGLIDGIKVQVELKGKSFKLKLKGMGATSTLVGEDITFGLQIGVNIGEETIHMSRKESKLLKYKRKKKFACGK
ncbi:MAG: hypothetical protein ACE5F1_19845, partial [Planctomycetota bacterium]